MRICFLSSFHPPFDKRVFHKEAVSLAQWGFETIHLAPDEQAKRCVVSDVNVITYKRPRGIRDRLLQLPSLYIMAKQLHADCYHCNEVDSWLIGVLLKLTGRHIKVIFDVHEHYPSTFAEGRFPVWAQPAIAQAVRGVFRLLLPFTDHLVFAKRSVAIDFKGSETKQVLVQNFAPTTFGTRLKTEQDYSATTGLRAIHLGLISRMRGWPQLLDALAMPESDGIAMIKVVGTFNDRSQSDFESRLEELGLKQRVEYVPWLPFDQAYQEILSADIGLILFQPGPQNHVYALPHKMFDYMLAGLPIIAPDFAWEVSEIVRESDCGLLVNPAKPAEIANALAYLAANPNERKRLGQNGRNAVIERYNWEHEADKLLALYREMEETLAGYSESSGQSPRPFDLP